MTDAEIIKAKAHFEYGIKCDIFSEPVLSYAETVLEAFDLINRQKAEIDELRDVCGKCPMLKSKNNIIDSLKEQIKGWQQGYCELRQELKTAKAEAIKEFAERLKESTIDVDVSYGYGREHYTEAVAVIEVDNLVKEMAGNTE